MPRIAIAPCRAMADYLESVRRVGGEPVELDLHRDPPEDVVTRVDGLMLTGGGDVDPALYGEAPHESFHASEAGRDAYEVALIRAASEARLPIFAICRGMQVLNVALGGTLVQHIEAPGHMRELHRVNVDPGSRVAKAIGADVADACNSIHHQALDRIADGLTVTGTGEDGMVEAVEAESQQWIVAVQWHPEDTAAVDPQQQALFDELIAQAR